MRSKAHIIFFRIFSALLTLVYLTAVLGFDVHRDYENSKVYVGFLAAGISCERIHPDYPCHHYDCDSCEEEDCCSDTPEYLIITGDNAPSVFSVAPEFGTVSGTVYVPVEVCTVYTGHLRPVCVNSGPPPPSLSRLCTFRV